MGAGVIRTMASFAHLYFVFLVSLLSRFTRSGGVDLRSLTGVSVKNHVGAEFISELVAACPAHDQIGGGKSMGLGVRGHELQALPLMS